MGRSKKKNKNKNNSGFMGGVMFGGLIGFFVGMLMSPKSGDGTSNVFSERGQEWRDLMDDLLAAAREKMSAASERKKARTSRPDFPYDELDLDDADL